MGKQKRKQQVKGYMVAVCPNCGNDIPNRNNGFVCKYCKFYINPKETEIIKEFRKT